jgi:hypothetical protein
MRNKQTNKKATTRQRNKQTLEQQICKPRSSRRERLRMQAEDKEEG